MELVVPLSIVFVAQTVIISVLSLLLGGVLGLSIPGWRGLLWRAAMLAGLIIAFAVFSPIQGFFGLIVLGGLIAIASGVLFGLDMEEWKTAVFFAVVVIGTQMLLGVLLATQLAT